MSSTSVLPPEDGWRKPRIPPAKAANVAEALRPMAEAAKEKKWQEAYWGEVARYQAATDVYERAVRMERIRKLLEVP